MSPMRKLRLWWRTRRERQPAGTPLLSTPHRWLKQPDIFPNQDVALFVTVCRDNMVSPHAASYINALHREKWRVIVVLVTDDIAVRPDTTALNDASGILLRQNAGFDFAAWATLLALSPELWKTRRLIFCNDSMFGPFDGFGQLMNRLRHSDEDVIALTESRQIKPHFQSYFFMLQHRGLADATSHTFWQEVENLPAKWNVSRWYEVELKQKMRRANLTVSTLFPLSGNNHEKRRLNPSIHQWRELIDAGFPFIKVSALRDEHDGMNVEGWQERLAERGADVGSIEAYLRRVAPDAPALKANQQP